MLVLGIVVLLILFSGFGTMNYGYGGMMGMMYGNYGGGMMLFGWLFGVLILIVLVLLIVWLLQQIQNPRR